MLERLARTVMHHRRIVVVGWLLATLFGGFAAGQVSNRFLETFSIPGAKAYEANVRVLATFGSGGQPPLIAVFHAPGDVTQQTAIRTAITRAAAVNPGAHINSFFSTGSNAYVSADRHTTFAAIYPPGVGGFGGKTTTAKTRTALASALPSGVTSHVTGLAPLEEDIGGGAGPSIWVEVAIGGAGALLVLLFVFGTLPAVAMPLMVAVAAILNTFTAVWALTYVTDVSVIVQFLVALVGLGVAIDYSLLMIFRFREELEHGASVEDATVTTMVHAGRSVIVSGSTVAVGLVSMVIIPLPFIRSIGLGGMLIPAVSVVATITLLPAMLSLLGPRTTAGACYRAGSWGTCTPSRRSGPGGRGPSFDGRSQSPPSAS